MSCRKTLRLQWCGIIHFTDVGHKQERSEQIANIGPVASSALDRNSYLAPDDIDRILCRSAYMIKRRRHAKLERNLFAIDVTRGNLRTIR